MMNQIRRLILILATISVTYYILKLYQSESFILNLALLVLSCHVADIFIKIVIDSLPNQTLPDLGGRAVFITGCDTGFGNKLARDLDAKGVKVFAGCLFAKGPDALKLQEDCSKKLHIVQIDVTKDEEVTAAMKYVTNALGDQPLSAIVNNAGILGLCEMETMPIDEQRKIMEVNTFGVTRVTQAFLPLLKRSKGRVVIVSSLASYSSFPFIGAYSMAKAAALSYANTLRRELTRTSVSVHTIEPFAYSTNLVQSIPNNLEHIYNKVPESKREKMGGEEYLKRVQVAFSWIVGIFSQPLSRIHEVVHCMIDASIGKYPKMHYEPGLVGKIIYWLIFNIPEEFFDVLAYIGMTVTVREVKEKKVQ